MTVQIQPAKPKDEHNGLVDIEGAILANPHDTIVAVVTYSVKKITEDVDSGDRYPVLKIIDIHPLTGDLRTPGEELRQKAISARAGAEVLDLDFDGGGDE
ncbi:hypothetical protein [Herbiconiux sp.]|uniref:hypothetical protein n=1 Tax=Herbiconiux sp. TaxID=1871186 RepID=UPI0025C6FC98|nr:hypothetical protein [Herbiconiux sp.]